MSSKSIYTPYFYIIQDTRNGMYYAGAKWAQGCHPSDFMIEGGYITSSDTIKKLIEQHGLDVFVIRKIRTFKTADEAYNYETRFLKKIKARNNPKFYNGHENDGAMNVNKMKIIMMGLYGVENPFQAEEIKSKIKQTNLEKYGDEVYTRTDEYRQKYTKTCIEKYGVAYHTQSESTKSAQKETNIRNRGVENPSHCPEVRAKISASTRKTKGTAEWKATEGRKLGERTRAKFVGSIIITNGTKNRFIDPNKDIIADGWWKGRTESVDQKGRIRITDGNSNRYIDPNSEIPNGWWRGSKTKN
jgi:hypothetical protein